ncbi:MAG: hypothetical protein K8F92_02475 [Hyphomicrobium sp.]|uniref:hypothetical protein n=1 Tax=Hyphomicrobium sp. TaxID=82 RepID=UPI001320BCDF|nr:hypothetical protein [Hyphomicrobium sp.]KAB2942536.1 MAG: hypothetical protein F9K20_05985 [Hyphomicrobium sp.]MBZ0208507.1 hypothetical protein [Hyphomicrobium sp.]
MKFIASGRVHPERADIRFDKVGGSFGDGGLLSIGCESSQLSVVLDLPDMGSEGARLVAQHYATMFVSALGFSNGCGYSAEIVQLFDEHGTAYVFGVQPTDDERNGLGFGAQTEVFTRAVLLAADNIFFRLALRDYSRALAEAEDCASYCYRAVEAIKSAFGSWEEMHTALHTDRKAIDERITTYAAPVRHGNWASTKPAEGRVRWEMLSLTRGILSAFLEYAKPSVASVR